MMPYRIAIKDFVVYYKIWYQVPYDDYMSGRVVEVFVQDCADVGIILENIRNYTWVIDCGPEGIGAQELHAFYTWMMAQGVAPTNFRVVFTGKESLNQLPYPAINIIDRMATHQNLIDMVDSVNWQSVRMDHDFICLMRRGSVDRVEFGKLLLDHFDLNRVLLTLGTDDYDPDHTLAKIMHPHPFPVWANNTATYSVEQDLFYRAPVNLVVESSSQIDTRVWQNIFITEKTFKSIVWHQYPIWYAVPGLVEEVRKLGFDVFDDVFENHYYDNIQDVHQRRQEIIKLLHRTLALHNMPELRPTHWARFEKNVNHYCNLNTAIRKGVHANLIQQFAQEQHV
jgi:hypothetical protein